MATAVATNFRKRLAEAKAGGVVSLRHAWSQAIDRAEKSGVDDSAMELFVNEFLYPSSLLKLSESLDQETASPRKPLTETIERYRGESEFSTEEWIQALERMMQFLIRSNRTAQLSVTLGYLSCAAEYLATSGSTLGFAEDVERFLEEFGFDG